MKIIIFGAGKRCEELLEENKLFLKEFEIVAFADNDKNKQGKLFHNKKIISPEEIFKYEYDFIYVASIYFSEIHEQLINKLKIDPEKIKKDNYLGILYGQREYQRHYEKLEKCEGLIKKDNNDINNCRIVVYTAIFGGYDKLKDPEYIDRNIDYVCFTDDLEMKSDIWSVVYVEKLPDTDPRRASKIYKILPHKYFSDYDVSIWIDGTATVRGNLREYIKKYMKYSNILFCPHPWRNCIYQEAEFAIEKRPFEGVDLMKAQIEYYRKEGIPKNNGLISSGFIVRRHNESDVIYAMEDWWREICKFSTQCQISFQFIAWKNNLRYDVASEWIYENKYIYLTEHLINEDDL